MPSEEPRWVQTVHEAVLRLDCSRPAFWARSILGTRSGKITTRFRAGDALGVLDVFVERRTTQPPTSQTFNKRFVFTQADLVQIGLGGTPRPLFGVLYWLDKCVEEIGG